MLDWTWRELVMEVGQDTPRIGVIATTTSQRYLTHMTAIAAPLYGSVWCKLLLLLHGDSAVNQGLRRERATDRGPVKSGKIVDRPSDSFTVPSTVLCDFCLHVWICNVLNIVHLLHFDLFVTITSPELSVFSYIFEA